MVDENTKREVSQEELDIAFSGQAPGVNRFFTTLGATGLRIAFAEENSNGKSFFRNAVTMHPQDGIKLYKLIQTQLAEVESKLDKMKNATKEPADIG